MKSLNPHTHLLFLIIVLFNVSHISADVNPDSGSSESASEIIGRFQDLKPIAQPQLQNIPINHANVPERGNGNVFPDDRVGRAGVPRFQGTKKNRKRNRRPHPNLMKPSRLGEAQASDAPMKRQDGGGGSGGGPGLNVSSVSPLELSLGGLTGLQGLPPLSIIQFVKLLVAVTPFIIPLVFVPILIFTIGMFMIPVKNSNLFFGDEGLMKRSGSWDTLGLGLGGNFLPSLSTLARGFANHEECIERLTCEIGRRFIPDPDTGEKLRMRKTTPYKRVIARLLNQLNHPLLRRISRSLTIPSEDCQSRKCSPFSFMQKILNIYSQPETKLEK